ncbi:uncharacterized protein LOC116348363 [Contarinia nasturtii]|uniref:uncharacterized protein LOC116348363 n=1 Tax=Contarinia nasturtii TaxID=265458 RepID=UPI0012D4AF22|nr:uncharacterized protein LOC116348363 [Contarinia nasturtii]
MITHSCRIFLSLLLIDCNAMLNLKQFCVKLLLLMESLSFSCNLAACGSFRFNFYDVFFLFKVKMIIYTVLLILYLSKFDKIEGGICGRKSDEFNIDNFQYVGDPVTVVCITEKNQTEFYLTEVNGSVPPDFIKRLHNGRDMSLFFHGIENKITQKKGFLFFSAKAWFDASQKNICIFSYAYTTDPTTALKILPHVSKMVKTKRLEYVARMARDMVLAVYRRCVKYTRAPCLQSMSQVDVSGFSFGAHIAGRTCQYLEEKTGEKVRMLLALDPAKFPPFGAKAKNTIKSGHANYVQVIHTSNVVGIWDQLGDTDIYVKFKTESSFFESIADKHQLSYYMHVTTASKRLFLIAEQNENRNGTVIKSENAYTEPKPKSNECLVGVYSTLNPRHRGKKFTISLTNYLSAGKSGGKWKVL